MHAATKIELSEPRLADKNSLEKLYFTVCSLAGLRDVPACARSWIPFFVSLIKLGYDGVKTPMAALVEAQYRCSAKGNRSQSSAYSALKWLEENHWIKRSRFKVGKQNRLTILTFNMQRFEFIIKSVSPQKPTCEQIPYKSAQLQILESDDRTKTDRVRSHTSVYTTKESKEHAKSSRIKNPVKTSCKYVLFKRKPYPIDAGRILRRIDAELTASVDQSVDWPALENKWSGLLIQEREYIAKTEILPALRLALSGKRFNSTLDDLVKSLANTDSGSVSDGPTSIQNANLESQELELLMQAQNRLLWARKNQNY